MSEPIKDEMCLFNRFYLVCSTFIFLASSLLVSHKKNSAYHEPNSDHILLDDHPVNLTLDKIPHCLKFVSIQTNFLHFHTCNHLMQLQLEARLVDLDDFKNDLTHSPT